MNDLMTTEPDRRPDAADETIADPDALSFPASGGASGEQTPDSVDNSQAELAEVKDRLVRALADQENF